MRRDIAYINGCASDTTAAGFAPGAAVSSASGPFQQARCIPATVNAADQRPVTESRGGHRVFARAGGGSYVTPTSGPCSGNEVVDLDALFDEITTPDLSERMVALRKQLGTLEASGGAATLRELRLQAGLSQKDLAKRLKTDQAYVSKLERGGFRDPSLSRAMELADALGVSLGVIGKAFMHFSRQEPGDG